ncbi:MAG: hypothetical protein QM784_11230 [Polyangiaceae bacterium]
MLKVDQVTTGLDGSAFDCCHIVIRTVVNRMYGDAFRGIPAGIDTELGENLEPSPRVGYRAAPSRGVACRRRWHNALGDRC